MTVDLETGDEKVTPALVQLCRDHGIKLTRPRRLILTEMERAKDHPTAADVYLRLKGQKVSLATVYRTLVGLSERGLIRQVKLPGSGPLHFELAPLVHHDHLIDVKTGRVMEVHNPQIGRLLERLAAKIGYRVTSYSLEIIGERENRRTHR